MCPEWYLFVKINKYTHTHTHTHIAIPFSKGSSQPRDWTQVSLITGRFFTSEPPEKPKKTGVGSLISSPGNLSNPGIELGSSALQMDSVSVEPRGKPKEGECKERTAESWVEQCTQRMGKRRQIRRVDHRTKGAVLKWSSQNLHRHLPECFTGGGASHAQDENSWSQTKKNWTTRSSHIRLGNFRSRGPKRRVFVLNT